MNSTTIDHKLLIRTIYIIDDDDDILQSLIDFFQLKGFKVKGFSSALDYLAELDSKPGLVISDISMPQMNGIELIKKLNKLQHLRPVLFMTGVASIELAVEAMQLGARDFIEKPFSTSCLLSKVLGVLEKFEAVFLTNDLYRSLTKREVQIFELVVSSLTNQQIADKLFITTSTVEKHRSSMMKKMRSHNLNELMQRNSHLKEASTTRNKNVN